MSARDDLIERGPRITVNLSPVREEKSLLSEVELSALINTASEATWVDLPCLNRLRLNPLDDDSIPWFNGQRVEVGLYRVHMEILTANGFDRHDMVEVVGADLSFLRCEVILGRGILSLYELTYSGPTGTFQLKRA